MRSSYIIALIGALIVAGTYWYQSTAAICPAPLSYRLGTIDASFELSPEQATQYLLDAEAYWESNVGRELFTYDAAAEFTVDFVFDERQEFANTELALRKALDAKKEKSESVKSTIETLQAEYQSLASSHEAKVTAYESRLVAYNEQVQKYNDRGGAPQYAFEQLEGERVKLAAESTVLNRTAQELSDLASKINKLVEEGSRLVTEYNREVSAYNEIYGDEHEFTQGDYQGAGGIHVYKFSSDTEVVRVLAHEFGHALGLSHVEGTASLMYYLLEDTNTSTALTANDLEAYHQICGTEESTTQQVRRVIRELLANI